MCGAPPCALQAAWAAASLPRLSAAAPVAEPSAPAAAAEWYDNPAVSAQDAVKILVHQIQQSGPISAFSPQLPASFRALRGILQHTRNWLDTRHVLGAAARNACAVAGPRAPSCTALRPAACLLARRQPPEVVSLGCWLPA